ncbi:MAG: hypothetical protein KKC68_06630 [Candidatus Thermoplasmatota archaeon]|nr:hypothetical protein [Candidatus Thermoplasmatota archaeon]
MKTIESTYQPTKKELVLERLKESHFFREFIKRLPEGFDTKDISFSLKYHAQQLPDEIRHEKGLGITREIKDNKQPANDKPLHLIREKGEVYRDG